MKSFPLDDIPPSKYFTKPVYLDSQFIVTAPEMPVSKEILGTVSKWGFNELLSDGELREHYASETVHAKKETKKVSRSGDMDKIQKAEIFYDSFQKYVKTIFAFIPVRDELDFKIVAEHLKSVCDFVRDNRRYLMRTDRLLNPVQEEKQLISHTTRSTIIAIIIGSNMKLQSHKLIELAAAALFHEVGMIKLPQENYTNKSSLTEQERKLLYAHPILGYNILRAFNFPLEICMAALEHHERENGTGYPRQKTGIRISLYAKIIAVACSYEAILSSRAYKDAKNSHIGIMELLKNEGKQYDDTVVRALVYSLSIYPIGLYVLLSDGKKGQVVDVDPENPRYPIVEILGELMPNGKNRTRQTSSKGFSIVRPLSSEEIEGV